MAKVYYTLLLARNSREPITHCFSNRNTWLHEQEVGGYGNGEFEYTTGEPRACSIARWLS